MRTLDQTETLGTVSDVAQTGPPACASTALSPTARSSVLLPAMFDPVTISTVPGGPTVTSLGTRRSPGSKGCPSASAIIAYASGDTSGHAHPGLRAATFPKAASASM